MLGRRIQAHEHDSVEDARASMELFKRVQSEWKMAIPTDLEEKKAPSKSSSTSLKRKRSEGSCMNQLNAADQQCMKRSRLDSESLMFLSDTYWPEDIQVCWF